MKLSELIDMHFDKYIYFVYSLQWKSYWDQNWL
jgi:hypothetical protein